ncbi:hypothetical protein UY3_15278 [Chelonia mydas]|uniref:Uncharacterized protein n=1 Tax=Chelonia mydas TaxID=8469 RepID=M7BHB0_CHEMY|nr:hypothetical protein UY3_15278 [Chelonia mydas]
MASAVAEPASEALLDPLGLLPGRNPGPTLSDIFSGLHHFCSTFHCASALGACSPDAFSSGPVVDSSTVLSSDFGTSLHGVFAPVSHACTIVDIDLDAGTYGPGTDVGTGPPNPSGSCECANAAPSDGRELPLPAHTSPSSSPDEALVGTAITPALEDNRVLQQLRCRAAQDLGIKAEEVVEEADPMVDILAPLGPSRVALPLIKIVVDTTKTLWQMPSLPPTAKCNERRYFVPSRGFEHLYSHLPPDLLVVDVANQRERQGFQGPSPKNRDSKCLELVDRKICSTGGLQLRIANQQDIVSRYPFNTCAAMAKFTELVPSDSWSEFTALVEEGKLVSWAALQAALDAADAATRVMATGVAM